MTNLADLSANAQIITAGIADEAITSPKTAFDVQYKNGASASYLSISSYPSTVYTDSVPGTAMAITYTPDADGFWEISYNVGIVRANDASFYYSYCYLDISPNPNNAGTDTGGLYETRYAGLTTQKNTGPFYYGKHSNTSIFDVSADTEYTATLKFTASGGSSWSYYAAATHLWLYGKGWQG